MGAKAAGGEAEKVFSLCRATEMGTGGNQAGSGMEFERSGAFSLRCQNSGRKAE